MGDPVIRNATGATEMDSENDANAVANPPTAGLIVDNNGPGQNTPTAIPNVGLGWRGRGQEGRGMVAEWRSWSWSGCVCPYRSPIDPSCLAKEGLDN